MINLAIADDQLLFRKGMLALLRTFEGMDVLFEAGNGRELLNQCPEHTDKLHIVLLDLSMPEMDGLETLKVLKKDYPEVKVIIISVHEGDNYIVALIEAGANGYLAKNAEPEDETRTWADEPLNWINTGLLVYFPAAFVIFTFSNYLIKVTDQFMDDMVWMLHATLVMLMYILFTIAFRKCRQ